MKCYSKGNMGNRYGPRRSIHAVPIKSISNARGALILTNEIMLMRLRSFSARAKAIMLAGAPIGSRNPPILTAIISANGTIAPNAVNRVAIRLCLMH